MPYIIDVQGFQYEHSDFICKEIAILNMKNGKVFHRHINLPFPSDWFKPTIREHFDWTTRNCHGLLWDHRNVNDKEQYLPMENLHQFIKNKINPNEPVYVKGLMKKRWLSNIIPKNTIVDLIDLGCNNLKFLEIDCNLNFHCHNHFRLKLRCARKNIFLLKDYIINKPSYF